MGYGLFVILPGGVEVTLSSLCAFRKALCFEGLISRVIDILSAHCVGKLRKEEV